MKKSISVNIKGRIFNIEEEAFDVLKKYLDSIKSYFSSYEDSTEIYDDIENRVAEILHDKLSKTKEVITSEDVDLVIETIGKVEDFDEQEEEYHQQEESSTEEQQQQEPHSKTQAKRLYRDTKREIVSGVCAGMAHYFSTDPFWIRLLFVLGMFLSGFFPVLIIYIVLAIILPKRNDLDEIATKKFFRDGEGAVIGGVSAGIAKYFATDPVWIRLLFVVSAFAGFGILAYIIIWMITPEAKTRSEKMQMEGEPMTISNIEKNVKDNLNLKDRNGEESVLATILLFPFRLIAQILVGLSNVLGPLSEFVVQAIRYVGGFGFTVVGLAMMSVFVIFLSVGLGLISGEHVLFPEEMPISMFSTLIPGYGLIASFFTGFFPALLLILLGIGLLLKRNVVNPIVIGAIFGFWIISLGVLAASGAYIAKNFREKATVSKEYMLEVNSDELTVELQRNGVDLGEVDLLIKTTPDSVYRLVQESEARGSGISEARKNAEKIVYTYDLKGSRLLLNEAITFTDSSIFSDQEVSLTLYIPEGKKVRISKNVLNILQVRHFISSPYIYDDFKSVADLKDRVWLSTEDEFKCINCSHIDTNSNDDDDRSTVGNSSAYNFSNFSKIKISHAFDVRIKHGTEFKVKAVGSNDDLEDVRITQNDEWLEIDYERFDEDNFNIFDFADDSRDVKVYIELPFIEELDISGATLVDAKLEKETNLTIDLSGASQLELSGTIDNLTVDISGASEADFSGKCTVLNAEVSGASQLNSRDMICDVVTVEASGASTAKVYAKDNLEAEASGASTIKYKGNPQLNLDEDGFADIKKD